MFLRLFQAKIDESRVGELLTLYEDVALPSISKAPGNLAGLLLQPTIEGESYISMTVWGDSSHADAWQTSASFKDLFHRTAELVQPRSGALASSGVTSGEKAPAIGVSQSYTLETGRVPLDALGEPTDLFMRIVSLRVRDEGWDDLVELYDRHVIPKLDSMEGCLGTALFEGFEDPDEGLSLSTWERQEDAERYELSGAFDILTRKLKGSLTMTRGWQPAITSEGTADGNPPTHGYRILAGRRSQDF